MRRIEVPKKEEAPPATNAIKSNDPVNLETRFQRLEEEMLQLRSGNNDYQAHIHEVLKDQSETIRQMEAKIESLYNYERFPEDIEQRMKIKFGDLFNQEIKKNAYHA